MADHILLKEWKEDKIKAIKLVHPDWSTGTIEKMLNKLIDERLEVPECAINNNYLHKAGTTNILTVYDMIETNRLITAGGGVMFLDQYRKINPPSSFLDGALTKRKMIKKDLKKYKPGSYEYMMTDLRQLTEKVVANSYYGASGNEISPFYNLYTATATTSSGQSLISCMMCAFESFYSNNVLFYDIDDFLLYVSNSIHKNPELEPQPIKDLFDASYEMLIEKFYNMFDNRNVLRDEKNQRIIADVINNLNQDERNKLFYSSNLFEFIETPSVEKLILDIVYNTISFKDPNSVPDNIKMDLDRLWDILEYWVVYNHPTFNRINRLKFKKRKCVVTIDTDSNMLNINRWMEYWDRKIILDKTISGDPNEIMYIKCNILCYIMTKYTQVILKTYSKISHIPDEFAPRLNMKNEFLYLRMVLYNKKKRYTGLIRLREGNELIPEKLDCKGLDYMKSTCSQETKEYFMNMVHDDILYSEKISGSLVLKHVNQFAKYIENSLRSGEKRFLNPLSVKDPDAYAKPFSNQGIRGTYVWNLVYPDIEIKLPDKVTVVKVNMTNPEDFDDLRISEPEIYNKIMTGVFNNPECPFADKGVSVICIPSQVERVPEWITKYINTSKIVDDNITKIHPILKSLGLSMIDRRANEPQYSNIIVF